MGVNMRDYLAVPAAAIVLLFGVIPGLRAQEDKVCFDESQAAEARIISCTRLLLQKGADPVERARIHSNRGVAFGQNGETKRAIDDFNQALAAKPKDPAILNNRCYFLAVDGQFRKALADCDAALQQQQATASMLDSRGYAHLRGGDLDKALKDYDAALGQDPTYPSALWGRGIILQRKGRSAEAERDFAVAQRVNPHIEREMAGVGLKRSQRASVSRTN